MTPKLKKIIIAIIVLIVLFVVYAIFFKSPPTNDPLVMNESSLGTSEEAKILGNQISQALLRIEQIKLEKTIFDSDIYKSLKDRSQPIEQEPIGRSNPFAPIGDISVNSSMRIATSTATSTKFNASSTRAN